MGKIKCPVCSGESIEVVQHCTLGECDSCKHLMILEEHEEPNTRSDEDKALIAATMKFAKICNTDRSNYLRMVNAEFELLEAVEKHSDWKED